MHARELVELGALVAIHGSKFLQFTQLLTQRHLEDYWLASRTRHDRWAEILKEFEQATSCAGSCQWSLTRAVMEEILASELLTRVWTAAACTYPGQSQEETWEPVVRSILSGHLEARNRVLHILVRGQGFSCEDGKQLHRIARQTQRWTDLLLGYLAGEADVTPFAFDAARVRDFAVDLRDEHRTNSSTLAWQLTLASLRHNYQKSLLMESPHGDLNQRIAASILACFHSDLWDASGGLPSTWLLRINQVTSQTQNLVEDLMHLEQALEG
jgi:hypothetical protein